MLHKMKLLGKNLNDIRPLLAARHFMEIPDGETPELVVAYGGDGTMLIAEREYPGVPKLLLRDAGTAPLCADHTTAGILDDFCAGTLDFVELRKVEGHYGNKRILGVNDIFIHNRERVSALRYQVSIDDELYATEVVGDGVGVSTVHGSTAYYRSITHSIFRVGLGLAFSNSTEEVNHLVLNEKSIVKVRIIRGPGLLVADNSVDFIEVPEGGEITICAAPEMARVYGLKSFMCPKCRMLRHPNKYPFKNYLPL